MNSPLVGAVLVCGEIHACGHPLVILGGGEPGEVGGVRERLRREFVDCIAQGEQGPSRAGVVDGALRAKAMSRTSPSVPTRTVTSRRREWPVYSRLCSQVANSVASFAA